MRDPTFDLAAALAQPGFTPGARDVDALLALLEGEDDALVKRATRGLVALRHVAREALVKRLRGAPEPQLATRMIAALGALARTGDAEATRALLPLVTAPSERWRRAAVVALGKLGGDAARGLLPDAAVDEARAVILARWDASGLEPPERRALTEAMGKLGGGAAVEKLEALETEGDAELARRRDRALVMSRRDSWRLDAVRATAGDSLSGASASESSNEVLIEVRGGESSGWDGPTDPDGLALGAPGRRGSLHERGDRSGERGDQSGDRSGDQSEDEALRSGHTLDDDPEDSPFSINASDVDAEATVPESELVWHCRGGLGPLLAEELTALGHRIVERNADWVRTRFAGRLGEVHEARLWTQLGLVVPLGGGELAAAITEAICQPQVRKLLPRLTRGVVRWRLELASGGPRRAMVWQVVRDVAQRAPELINEPADTTWTIVVDEARRTLQLRPRRLADPRFTWRQIDLPSASHPTVAAAVAALGKPRVGERVWDPFTGSGSELIECAIAAAGAPSLLRPSSPRPGADGKPAGEPGGEPAGEPGGSNEAPRRSSRAATQPGIGAPGPTAAAPRGAAVLDLLGTDLDGDALDAAARNASAAGVPVILERADARSYLPGDRPGTIDLIASNPPLGGRLRGDAGQLLCDALPGFAASLRRGGRMVWITPAPRRTSPVAEALGLVLERAFDVDLGGLRARLERWRKPD